MKKTMKKNIKRLWKHHLTELLIFAAGLESLLCLNWHALEFWDAVIAGTSLLVLILDSVCLYFGCRSRKAVCRRISKAGQSVSRRPLPKAMLSA